MRGHCAKSVLTMALPRVGFRTGVRNLPCVAVSAQANTARTSACWRSIYEIKAMHMQCSHFSSSSRVSDDGSDSDFAPESKVKTDPNDEDGMQKFLKTAVENHDVLLFMKGSPEAPQCGFSAKVSQILRSENVDFSSADVLANPEVREGIKKFSDWPTIPQLYVQGEFIGGCDIISDMYETGELSELLEPIKQKQKGEKTE